MIVEKKGSRRAFIVGGVAATAAAVPFAMAAVNQAVGPIWSPAAPKAPADAELAQWEKILGGQFKIAGELGKGTAVLSAVVRGSADSGRPAGLGRAKPFTAYFEMGPRLAPKGQKTYRIGHPTKGAIDLFLGRGADKRGKAVLYAIFN